jgi:hypothetical protein
LHPKLHSGADDKRREADHHEASAKHAQARHLLRDTESRPYPPTAQAAPNQRSNTFMQFTEPIVPDYDIGAHEH